MGPQHKHSNLVIYPDLVMSICIEYEQRRFKFMQDFITAHGRIFGNSPFNYVYPHAEIGGTCYAQAHQLMLDTGLIYCEGVMLAATSRGVIPMPHAWCATPRGELVDPICHKYQHRQRLMYWGIAFQQKYVEAWEQKTGFPGMLDGHPELGDTVGPYADDPKEWKLNCI